MTTNITPTHLYQLAKDNVALQDYKAAEEYLRVSFNLLDRTQSVRLRVLMILDHMKESFTPQKPSLVAEELELGCKIGELFHRIGNTAESEEIVVWAERSLKQLKGTPLEQDGVKFVTQLKNVTHKVYS